jgi:hypothetical protein
MDQVRTPLGQTLALLDGTGRRRNRPVDIRRNSTSGRTPTDMRIAPPMSTMRAGKRRLQSPTNALAIRFYPLGDKTSCKLLAAQPRCPNTKHNASRVAVTAITARVAERAARRPPLSQVESHGRARRCPNPMPRIPAFRRSAPSVRFIFFLISASGVRAFEYALSWRRSSSVQGVT